MQRTTHFPLAGAFAGLICLLFFLPAAAHDFGSQNKEAGLDQVLKQMEGVGSSFRNFAALFSQKKYTAVLEEFDTPESGVFRYARAKDGTALLRQEVTSPGRRILTIKGGIATIYQPDIKQAQLINLGKNKDKVEYLALGIGQSPTKLQETFDIKYQGDDSIEGARCSVLVLRPKSAAAALYFSSITLWIRKSNGIPIQQKLQEPSKDYLLVNFFDEKLNVRVPESTFEQKLPSGVDVQKIQ